VRRIRGVDLSAHHSARGVLPVPGRRQLDMVFGTALILVGLLLVGIVLQAVGVSFLRHARDQSVLYEQFRYSLADASAPIGQTDFTGALLPVGTPVSLLEIPELGVDEVVVEGTTSRGLISGPGHRRDTVLPGQVGASVVMGRQSVYGGPFGGLSTLAVGDVIRATTGQGTSEYRVSAVRHAGDPQPAALAAGESRLTLVSATGIPFLANDVVRVDAELVGDPYPSPASVLLVGSLLESESAYASDDSGWLPLLLVLELAAVAVTAFTLASRRWGTWHTWVVAVPVSLFLGCTIAEQVIVLLPNLL
jgi:LPXTG-site transpeptidase (sortase) family protein